VGKRYPKARFILITRPIEDRVQSVLAIGWASSYRRWVLSNKYLRSATGVDENSEDEEVVRVLFQFSEDRRYEGLPHIRERACFISFSDFMGKFRETLELMKTVTGAQIDIDQCCVLRKMKVQTTATDIDKYG